MISDNTQVAGSWKIEGIGEFTNKEIKMTLNISDQALYHAKKAYKKTGQIPHWWQKSLWLMVYDQKLIRSSSYSVDPSNYSVRYIRETIVGLGPRDFGLLFGVSEQRISSLEFRERLGEKHRHLMNVLLKLLSTKKTKMVTIRRLLHLARFKAQTSDEHEAVSRLRSLLIPKPQP